MTHDRPYKRAMSHDSAIKELRRHAGTQFDPDLVQLFCELFATDAPRADPEVVAMTAALAGLPPPAGPVDRRRRRRRSPGASMRGAEVDLGGSGSATSGDTPAGSSAVEDSAAS